MNLLIAKHPAIPCCTPADLRNAGVFCFDGSHGDDKQCGH